MYCGKDTQLSISSSIKKCLCDPKKEFYSSSKTCPASSKYIYNLECWKQNFVNDTVTTQVSNFHLLIKLDDFMKNNPQKPLSSQANLLPKK